MSIFGSIMSSIFGGSTAAAPAAASPTSAAPPTSAASSSSAGSHGNGGAKAGPSAAPQAAARTQPGASVATVAQVDVAAVMDKLAGQSDEDLDWRKSIVDLMKLLKLDSSLAARKQLAQELRYTGDTKDSASMNIWLHKQVMIKLAQNGGKVPAELKH